MSVFGVFGRRDDGRRERNADDRHDVAARAVGADGAANQRLDLLELRRRARRARAALLLGAGARSATSTATVRRLMRAGRGDEGLGASSILVCRRRVVLSRAALRAGNDLRLLLGGDDLLVGIDRRASCARRGRSSSRAETCTRRFVRADHLADDLLGLRAEVVFDLALHRRAGGSSGRRAMSARSASDSMRPASFTIVTCSLVEPFDARRDEMRDALHDFGVGLALRA